jgi:nicotinamide mononucleotide adenylyltransferase
MIDAIALGRMIAEDIANTPGPCLYPGKFHPPHEGHFKAANVLASKPYVTEVIIILSAKVSPETGNITPEDAMQIWQVYLKAQPNESIIVQ